MSSAAVRTAVHFTLDMNRDFLLFGQSVGEENFKLRVNFAPVSATHCPFFCDINLRKIKHFQKCVVIRKYGFAFGYFPELSIEILYGISGVYQCSDRLRILEIR